jgi:hypothetical protein
MLAMIAALTLTAASVPSVEYKVERLGSKEVLLEGNAPIELQRQSRFEHEQSGNSVQMELLIRPTETDERVTVDLQFAERSQNGSTHKWSVTVVLLRGVMTTSDVSWGEGGWRFRLKVG